MGSQAWRGLLLSVAPHEIHTGSLLQPAVDDLPDAGCRAGASRSRITCRLALERAAGFKIRLVNPVEVDAYADLQYPRLSEKDDALSHG